MTISIWKPAAIAAPLVVSGSLRTSATAQIHEGAAVGSICVHLMGGPLAAGEGKFVVQSDGAVTGSVTTRHIEDTTAYIQQGAPGKSGPKILFTLKRVSRNVWAVPPHSKLPYQSYLAGALYVIVAKRPHRGQASAQLAPEKHCEQ